MTITALTISFERFDEACRVDWEWRNREQLDEPGNGWHDPPTAAVRETVHERMRNTLAVLGIEIANP